MEKHSFRSKALQCRAGCGSSAFTDETRPGSSTRAGDGRARDTGGSRRAPRLRTCPHPGQQGPVGGADARAHSRLQGASGAWRGAGRLLDPTSVALGRSACRDSQHPSSAPALRGRPVPGSRAARRVRLSSPPTARAAASWGARGPGQSPDWAAPPLR